MRLRPFGTWFTSAARWWPGAGRVRWWVLLVWACCLARLLFYAAVLPLWEGYDEWAHFAVIRAMALRGDWLVARDHPVPRDVAESLALAPVPWELRSLAPPSVTHDVYWTLPREERRQREAEFRAMPSAWAKVDSSGPLTAYEALQAPLYYWLMAPVVRLSSAWSLSAQVMAVRWIAALIASLAAPLIFWIGRTVFADDAIALGCTAVAAVMPGFALDVARVGNDCLAVLLFTLLTALAVKQARGRWLGLALGLGLLTKAYFLTAVPALALVRRRRSLAALATAAIVAGWWYLHNLLTTGTLSGLSEAVLLRNTSQWELLKRAASLPWRTAVDAILFSHVYWGGWSSLSVRSWMYHLFYVIILVAAIGVLRRLRQPAIACLAAIYGAFWIGQCYNVLLLDASKGLPGSMGWYLYAVVGAEVVLTVAGLHAILPRKARPWAAPAGVLLFGLLDLYTVHAVAIPYYSGMIRHKANGALAAVHAADFQAVGWTGAVERLAAYKPLPEGLLVGLWTVYLIATLSLMCLPWVCDTEVDDSEPGDEAVLRPG